MTNKTVIQKNSINKIKSGTNPIDKKDTKIIMPEKVTEKKQKKPLKKSSALLAASMGRSAVDAVDAHSSRDVKGSSGLADTGPVTSYE